jgi:3-phosphoshikimate 1-carboxyvinyltransferase
VQASFLVRPCRGPLRGIVPVPADPSIATVALLLAALAEGTSELSRSPAGEPALAMVGALRALGVGIDEAAPGRLRVSGVGLAGLQAPAGPIDCGDSPLAAALLAGVLSAQHFSSTITGGPEVLAAPMARVAAALRRRGGVIEGKFHQEIAGELTAPLDLGPVPEALPLLASEESLPSPDPLTKGALLLSGLYAHGNSYVREPMVSADHAERLLRALGAPLETVASMVELAAEGWDHQLPAFAVTVPGDLSAALPLLLAGLLVPGSEVGVRGVGSNPTRSGLLAYARARGAALLVEEHGDALGEPLADVFVSGSPELRGPREAALTASSASPGRAVGGGVLEGELLLRAAADLPAACALMARGQGQGELSLGPLASGLQGRARLAQLATMAEALRSFGVGVEGGAAGLRITGIPDRPLAAADIDCEGDAGVAMAATILALAADGPCRIRGVDGVRRRFPRFAGTLRALGADVAVTSG